MALLKKLIVPLLLGLSLVPGLATAEADPRSKQEIRHLLDYIEQSPCEFSRNGSWSKGKKAAAHIRRKADYLEQRDLLPDAESFIERAASQSSQTGKPYQVRCGNEAVVPSSLWLKQELTRTRRQNQKP